MPPDYEFARLEQEDVDRVHAMEKELKKRYDREIVLIAYERSKSAGRAKQAGEGELGRSGDVRGGAGEPADGGLGGSQRGTTFGYTEAQFDSYPTLADLQTKYDGNPDGLHRSVGEQAHKEEAQEDVYR